MKYLGEGICITAACYVIVGAVLDLQNAAIKMEKRPEDFDKKPQERAR